MATWSWIIIGVAAAAAIVLLAFIAVGVTGRRRVERRRAEARVLREEADERTRRADEREALAGSIADEAHEEREQAQKLHRRAGKLDPGTDGDGQDREAEQPRRRILSR